MIVPDENPVSQIGGYDVKAQVHYLGPIVWTPVADDPEGVHRTDFEGAEPTALPPELTSGQANILAAAPLGWLLHDYILPELERRFGVPVTEREVLSTPDYPRCRKALVIVPQDGAAVVRLNEEVEDFSVPADCGYARLTRNHCEWEIQLDWLPVFPVRVQEKVHASVAQLAEAIVQGDEERAKSLARLSFLGLWADSPKSLRRQMHIEVSALLFHVGPYRSDLLDVIAEQFPQSVEALRKDYSLEAVKAEAQERTSMSGIQLKDSLEDVELLFARAKLSDMELRVVRLEAALSWRNEQWSEEDKEKFLKMRQGTSRAALHRARTKLRDAARVRSATHRKFLEAIFRRSGGEVR